MAELGDRAWRDLLAAQNAGRPPRARARKVAGIAVAIGARAAGAEPDEVLVSSTVRDLAAGVELTFEDRGSTS